MLYKVKLDIFEGPFDLLVYLIEQAEMNIYDIPISQITEQYIQYIEQMQQRDVVLAGEFMVLAASLIEIKSKMLLPRMESDGAENGAEDPRNELVARILEYKRYKRGAEELARQEEWAMRIHTKPREDVSIYSENPEINLIVDLEQFARSFALFLYKKKKIEEVQDQYARTHRQRMTIETRIEQMRRMFRQNKKLRFQELLGDDRERPHVVLTFLSVLELVRTRSLKVRQAVNFGEIHLAVGEEGFLEGKGEASDDQ